nr:hypothetical protein [uncultured Rhodopila sp.]
MPAATTLKLWREYRAAVCADDAEQMAELERLFGLDGKQEAARMIEGMKDEDEGEESK